MLLVGDKRVIQRIKCAAQQVLILCFSYSWPSCLPVLSVEYPHDEKNRFMPVRVMFFVAFFCWKSSKSAGVAIGLQ